MNKVEINGSSDNKYLAGFIRFTKDAVYDAHTDKPKPCNPANCKCCYWRPVWANLEDIVFGGRTS